MGGFEGPAELIFWKNEVNSMVLGKFCELVLLLIFFGGYFVYVILHSQFMSFVAPKPYKRSHSVSLFLYFISVDCRLSTYKPQMAPFTIMSFDLIFGTSKNIMNVFVNLWTIVESETFNFSFSFECSQKFTYENISNGLQWKLTKFSETSKPKWQERGYVLITKDYI